MFSSTSPIFIDDEPVVSFGVADAIVFVVYFVPTDNFLPSAYLCCCVGFGGEGRLVVEPLVHTQTDKKDYLKYLNSNFLFSVISAPSPARLFSGL